MNPTSRVLTTPGPINVPGSNGGYGPSFDRQLDALELLVEEFGCMPAASDSAVTEAAYYIGCDLPAAALRSLMSVCDLTGAYRVMAVLSVENPR